MNTNEFLTLMGPGRAQTRVLGSRFLALASPVSLADDVTAALDREKKQYHDATHWCLAARYGFAADLTERAGDAGEPKGTAGTPILREIQKRELTNTLVIVTRYFGGTKLGTGNLARAYGEAASLALNAAPKVIRRIMISLHVECAHDDQGLIYAIAQRYHADIKPHFMEQSAHFVVVVSPELESDVISRIRDESLGRIRAVREGICIL